MICVVKIGSVCELYSLSDVRRQIPYAHKGARIAVMSPIFQLRYAHIPTPVKIEDAIIKVELTAGHTSL